MLKKSTPPPTDEQVTILDAAKGTDNLMISALAGTGKTTTLEMVEKVVKTRPILYLVFNRKNADEAQKRMLSTTAIRTLNGMGHRIWSANGRSLGKPDTAKSNKILREIINASPKITQSALWETYDQVISGVALAKALGYVPAGIYPNAHRLINQGRFHSLLDERPDELTSDLIDTVLAKSIKLAYDGNIDYNDQVYMPALFGGTFPKFPLILVDEYQDLSPVNHALLERLAKGRLIGVGDPNQNIYGFRGAKAGGMAEATKTYGMTELDLSVSFRCPRAIVEHVRWHVPNFKWIKPGGQVNVAKRLSASVVAPTAAIICRNNAPLFRMAFQLIAAGFSVSVAGTDIGPRLVNVMRRLGDPEMRQVSVLAAIDVWLQEKLERESKNAPDLAECMRVFARHGTDLDQAIAYAEHLFKQDGSVKLMTGHKSKGLEFEYVYHLDPFLCGASSQDNNLRYVISTRSLDRLTEIESTGIEW